MWAAIHYLFLRFFYWILELFGECGIFRFTNMYMDGATSEAVAVYPSTAH
jgi:hypothetical protein